MLVNIVNAVNHCPGAVSLTPPVLVQLASQAGAVTRTYMDGVLFYLSRRKSQRFNGLMIDFRKKLHDVTSFTLKSKNVFAANVPFNQVWERCEDNKKNHLLKSGTSGA